MAQLEQYYKGQGSWERFLAIFGDDWTNSEFQKKLLSKVDNRIDFAKVIYYYIGETSLDWLDKNIPALDNLTPMECLKSERLINRLKVCLMRMH
ncbi:hypothetical protein ITJ86_06940 [Winogradskyella sp. F6397]|uniref:Antitoxin Xre/MbcA/ParS-like toxin-binding domain-containing protein n=1 Tax=Winogradskyella marina TaxID=2785530 RepID=A0ABS0EH80_9FLAO|nr:hypothetical protein [Winogradskyella marina]MBF8149628.1 hypothetical protein [Winogradskyella marina]